MKVRLPDRNDALVVIGGAGIVIGLWQVLPWLATVVGSLFLIIVGVVTAADGEDEPK